MCKIDRMHTVIAADPNGVPLRVGCGYCSSEHNYRGGPRIDVGSRRAAQEVARSSPARGVRTGSETFPMVSDPRGSTKP